MVKIKRWKQRETKLWNKETDYISKMESDCDVEIRSFELKISFYLVSTHSVLRIICGYTILFKRVRIGFLSYFCIKEKTWEHNHDVFTGMRILNSFVIFWRFSVVLYLKMLVEIKLGNFEGTVTESVFRVHIHWTLPKVS